MTLTSKLSALLTGAACLALAGAASAAPAAGGMPTPMGPAAVGTANQADDQDQTRASDNVSLLGRLPMPPGAKILADQSLIIGSGETWVGRVNLDLGRDVTAAYNFFLDRFQQEGWVLQSAVRGKTSLLVFSRTGRSATIEFQESKLVGSPLVTLTMSPVGATVR